MCLRHVRTAVCDWNGTLINDLPLVYESVKLIFSTFGLPAPTLREYREEMSQEWVNFYLNHGIPPGDSVEELKKTLNGIRKGYFESHWDSVELHSDAIESLSLFKARGMKVLLVTGEVEEVVERRLQQFNLTQFFDGVFGGAYRKNEILARLDLLPEESMYTDDDPMGLRGAKELGFVTVGMTHGYASEKRIRDANPDFVANNFAEVIEFMKKD